MRKANGDRRLELWWTFEQIFTRVSVVIVGTVSGWIINNGHQSLLCVSFMSFSLIMVWKPSKPRVKRISLISSFAQQHFNKPKREPKAKARVQKLIFQIHYSLTKVHRSKKMLWKENSIHWMVETSRMIMRIEGTFWLIWSIKISNCCKS